MAVGRYENEHQKRCQALQQQLMQSGMRAAFIQKPRNVFYYSGTGQPCNLWIPAEGEPILFTRRVHKLAQADAKLKQLFPASNFEDVMKGLQEFGISPVDGDKIGVELDSIPYRMVQSLLKRMGNIQLTNVSGMIMNQRLVKSEFEIHKIREAAHLWTKSHEAILQSPIKGKTEYQISAIKEFTARNNGGDGTVWFHRWDACLPGGCIVASGPNAWTVSGHAMTVTGVGLDPAFPWGASDRVAEEGDIIVIDHGAAKHSYHIDMARTYCVGTANSEQKDLWEKLTEVHLRVIEHIREGVTGADVYEIALKQAKKFKLEQNFMGVNEDRGDYIGHSIGLELDEWPVLGPKAQEPLPANAVITIEPKFMIPGVAGMMVEDSILVKKNGYEIIGSIDHELFEV